MHFTGDCVFSYAKAANEPLSLSLRLLLLYAIALPLGIRVTQLKRRSPNDDTGRERSGRRAAGAAAHANRQVEFILASMTSKIQCITQAET